jgi:hypothetical protein
MAEPLDQTEALDWVLAKLSAATPKASLFKPPALKPLPQPSLVPTSDKLKNPLRTEVDRELELTATRKKEELLWHDWIRSGKKPETFVPLWKSHLRLINSAVGRFKGVEINKAALQAHATQLYYDALESWNPAMKGGAALHSHVYNNLRGLKRYVVKFQNTAKITEPLAEKITPFRTARAELAERLEYDPPLHQIVEYTHSKNWAGKKLSMKDALEVSRYVRRGFDISAGGEDVEGAGTHRNDPNIQIAHLIYHSLKPHEQKVHELLFPRDGGQPIFASGDIARKLGWHVSKVSKAKNVILTKIQERRPD